MITIEVRDDFISAAVFGEFTLEDFKEFEDAVEYRNRFGGPVDVLLDLRGKNRWQWNAGPVLPNFLLEHWHVLRRVVRQT